MRTNKDRMGKLDDLTRGVLEFVFIVCLALLAGACGTPVTITSKPCTVTAQVNGSLISCPDGTTSLVTNGLPGAAGAAGQDGTNGTNGVDGQQGTIGPSGSEGPQGIPGQSGVVTSVKLCSHLTVYPSVFVEVGFCIDHKLYTVYSTHGGYMTELPPGNYSSNTVGSKCNFTVAANCEVLN